RRCAVGTFEEGGDPAVHPSIVAQKTAARGCRAAYSSSVSVLVRLPDAAGEEPEQRQHNDDDQDDPENAHRASFGRRNVNDRVPVLVTRVTAACGPAPRAPS